MAIDARPTGELSEVQDGEASSPDEARTENDNPQKAPTSGSDETGDGDAETTDAPSHQTARRRWVPRSPVGWATATGAVMIIALAALTGWLGFRDHQSQTAEHQRQEFLAAGRQGAIDLTSIDFNHADADIQRILNSATGEFYDDFSKRSQPFVDVVKQVKSISEGTVTGAGIESETAAGADVLVAVTVKTANAGAQQQEPRSWRMRMTVQQVGDQAKVANVAFVP